MTTTEGLPMTPGRVFALVIGVPVALAIIGVVGVSLVAPFGEASIRVDRTLALRGVTADVTVDNPDLSLRASTTGGRLVRVSGTLAGAFTRPTLDLRATGRGVIINSNCVVPTGNCSQTLDVTVPAGLPVLASDETGNLNATDLSGRVTLAAGSGDLTAVSLSGTVSLSDSSGDIAASGVSGSIRISDGDGDISASALSGGALSLTDSSGDISVTGLAGTDVTGNAGSGDITLVFRKPPQRVDVTDSLGDITLVLPPGPVHYEVNAQTPLGSMSVDVKRSSSSPYVINARSDAGDITIEY
jgi:hypothetical protein